MKPALVALLIAAMAHGAQAQGMIQALTPSNQVSMLTDSTGGLWLVDREEGKVARCRESNPRQPLFIDVTDGVVTARPRGGSESQPRCAGWVAIDPPKVLVRPHVYSGTGTGG